MPNRCIWLFLLGASLPSAALPANLAPDRSSAPPRRAEIARADSVRKRMPRGFTCVVQPPFVVAGDEPEATVKRRASRTIQWTVDQLRSIYFDRDPADVIEIWLFRNDKTYRKYAKALFGDDPDTPFGYYSSRHKALIMNIGTGAGTLVHEIVHPFMAANFPACPAWFNEGLASLYEHSGEVRGRIHGYPNWRLPALQRAIRAGRVPPLERIMGLNAAAFYDEGKGINYAAARYLCYYLQQKGALQLYYREFARNHSADPSGVKTLQRLLEIDNLRAFQRRWERFVLETHYEE